MIDAMLKDTYTTPPDTRRALGDRLCFGTRIWGHLAILYIVYRFARQVRRGVIIQHTFAGYGMAMMRVFERCQGKFHVTGLDNISAVDGPVVIIGNHMSLLETMVLPCMIMYRRNMTYVIKKSLADLPIFGLIMKAMQCVTVKRDNPKDDFKRVMEDGIERLRNNQSVLIFPQSTRSAQFDPTKFNSIGIKLARAAGVPVIPLALKTDFLGNGRFLKDFGPFNRDKPIHFRFGEPLEITGTGKDQHNAIVAFIQENLAKWEAEEIKR